MVIDTGAVQAVFAVCIGAAGAWAAAIRPILKKLDRSRELSDALLGEPAIPELGKPERPGLFVTVARLAEAQAAQGAVQAAQGAVIDVIRHEVETNGGGSLKDDVRQLRGDVAALTAAAEVRETERATRDAHALV